jgi:hypothetical protein
MGQPLLDQGADAHDIMPPTPEELPPDTDAPFEVRHATRARRVPRGPRVPHAAAHFPPVGDGGCPPPLVGRASRLPRRASRTTRIRLGLTASPPQSPNHATKKWLRRNNQRPSSFRRSAGGAKEFSYADQMRIQALQEYQRRLAEPVNLSNEVLISFSSRMLSELDMRPYKTSLALYAKTFTANEFIEWAMTQPEVRDQCDALFIGSELLCRAVFLPVSYSRTDALFYSPTLKPGNGTYRLVAKKKAEVVAAIFGKAAVNLTVDVSEGGGSGMNSAQVSPSGVVQNGSQSSDALRRASSEGDQKSGKKPLTRSPRLSQPRKGILKRRHTSHTLGDIAEFEEYRRLRFLPRFARLAAFKAKTAARRQARAVKKSYRRTMHSAYAPVRAVKGWLVTRLGPHALFATVAPLILLHLFQEQFVAILCFSWWCWRHVARVDARQRRDLERRIRSEELARFQGRRGYAKLHKDGSETADWWSEVLRSFWDGWIEFWLNKLLTRILTNVLAKVKPAYLESLEITTFKLGDAPPKVNSSRCWRGNEGETILEWDVVWETKAMNITLSAKVGGSKFAVPVPLRVYVKDLRIAGKLRLGLFWTRRKGGPYLRRLRVSFVDVPEHSVVIKPMTSSFIDVRDLPGVDSAIENALNKLFTNVLVEPNCVNWDVEKWWINRPAAQPPHALGPDGLARSGGSITTEEQELLLEAERIRAAKGSSVSSMLAAGAGYAKKPTLSVSVSVHLAEMETREDAKPTSYFVKIKRGAKKFTTEGAKATPSETLVSSGQGEREGRFGSQGGTSSRGSSIGGESDDEARGREALGAGAARELFHDARENAHARSASAAVAPNRDLNLTPIGGKSPSYVERGHGRRASDFPVDYSLPSVEKKWMCRPVWEEFTRLDAFEKQIDAAVHVRVLAAATRGSRSKSVLGQGIIPNILAFADGHLHTVQLPLSHPRSGDVVGVIHLRVRATKLNEHVVAADKDFNPDASLLTAPSTYTKQFALNAADVLASGASGMAAVARAGLGTINPIPKKYVDSAASGITRAALTAVNEPVNQSRWAFRSMYKGCKKMYLGKAAYQAQKKEKVTRELEAAKRAAGYSEAWQASEQAAKMERSRLAREKKARRDERRRRRGSLGNESELGTPRGKHAPDDGYHSADSLGGVVLDETGAERVADSENESP